MTASNDEATAVFAKLIRALQPYAGEIVLIGGWVHALYLADANGRGQGNRAQWPVHTDDIDITIPVQLLTADRPTLVELALGVGFEFDKSLWFDEGKIPDLVHQIRGSVIDLDILARADRPDAEIEIDGQAGLVAHGYPDLDLLSDNTMWLTVGEETHATLAPPVVIRVPVPAAFVFQKALAAQRRVDPVKIAKDLVYIHELVRHPGIHEEIERGFPPIARAHPDRYATWRNFMLSLRSGLPPVSDAAEQLLEENRAQGAVEQIGAAIVAQMRRLVATIDSAVNPPPDKANSQP